MQKPRAQRSPRSVLAVAFERILPSTPIVDYIGIRPIEPRHVRALHRNTLGEGPKSVSPHAPVGIFARQVHPRFQRNAARERKRVACIEQPVKPLAGPRAAARRGKSDIAEFVPPAEPGP